MRDETRESLRRRLGRPFRRICFGAPSIVPSSRKAVVLTCVCDKKSIMSIIKYLLENAYVNFGPESRAWKVRNLVLMFILSKIFIVLPVAIHALPTAGMEAAALLRSPLPSFLL